MKLYSYWQSTATYRVRIALALKDLPFESVPIHLIRNGGEQTDPAYLKINPLAQVPALDVDGDLLIQSLAIIEYLDEVVPDPPLLPKPALERARVRALAQAIAADIHPLTTIRVIKRLGSLEGVREDARLAWTQHWITTGLDAVEKLLGKDLHTGKFCHGNQPGIADCCLVPQLYNARRYQVDLTPYPLLRRVETSCLALPAFQAAAPERQSDAG